MYNAYMTPYRFRSGGFGIAIPDDFSNATLRNVLVRASQQINLYCNQPRFPNQFDFRGGAVVDEQHEWPFTPPLLATSSARRVYLNSRPIMAVSDFRVYLAKNYYVSLPPSDNLYINKSQGYVEIVALAPTIIGYWPNGYPLGLWNPVALVSYTYGWQYAVDGDVLEADSPTVYTASYGSWLAGGDVTVEIDGVVIDPSDYTVSEDNGTVTFTTAATPGPGTVVTASYTRTLPDGLEAAVGIIATDLLAQSRMAARGMIGLSSLKVAEVSLTSMMPSQMVSRNGANIPAAAAAFLNPLVVGSAA